MRFLQILLHKLISLAMLAGGVVLVLWTLPQTTALVSPYIDRVLTTYSEFPDETATLVRYGIGATVAVIGFLTFLPLARKRHLANAITFRGQHGPITIQLSPIESTLNRAISNVPEVKKVSIKLHPDDRGKRVSIYAEATLQKTLSTGTSEMFDRVQSQIRSSATHILGKNEIADVTLVVSNIDFDGDTELFGNDLARAVLDDDASPMALTGMTHTTPMLSEPERALPGSPLQSAHAHEDHDDISDIQPEIEDSPEAEETKPQDGGTYRV